MFNTIYALVTAYIKQNVAIIRISGPQTFTIINSIIDRPITNFHKPIQLVNIINDQRQIIDHVMVTIFQAPHSFTGEDVIEINCHGSLIIVDQMLCLLHVHGARLADKGEFSRRAFLNDKIDLLQAESINDLINSVHPQSSLLAVNNLLGRYKPIITELETSLADVMAHIEVNIDYPEYDLIENLAHPTVVAIVTSMATTVQRLYDKSAQACFINDGIKTAIIGKPNVGKSSLLNALLQEDKAIVSNIPGTTRDLVEGYLYVGGYTLQLIDTAGIRNTDNELENLGIAKTQQLMQHAQLIILVLDSSQPLTDEDQSLLTLLQSHTTAKVLLAVNKQDLPAKWSWQSLPYPYCLISARDNNIDQLIDQLKTLLHCHLLINDHLPGFVNHRHLALLKKISLNLHNVIKALSKSVPLDLIEIDLKIVWNDIQHLSGKLLPTDLIDEIFKRFCLGK